MIGGEVLAAWTQIGRNGALVARVVTREHCPELAINGKRVSSHLRAGANKDFAVRTCELTMPRAVRRVEIAGQALPLPPARLRRIAVLGDTGCRIEVVLFQNCNDQSAWPFAAIARRIASAHPDLVVHVGDYYYRETACLVPECAGSPHGDGWPAWSADYFMPAQPIFRAASILAIRGNHENCRRGGLGWDRFLSVYPYGSCSDREPGYATSVGGVRFFVLDSANARDDRPDAKMVPFFEQDFTTLRKLPTGATTWLLTHRPMWELSGNLTGGTATVNATLDAAEGDPATLPVQLVLSGHVHLFEALTFADHRPPQIGVGTGGAALTRMPAEITGVSLDGTTVTEGTIRQEFGYAIFDLDAKTLDAYDKIGHLYVTCRYGLGSVTCERKGP